MELENTFKVPVGIDDTWALLLDVERVALCIPGAKLESVNGDDMTGRVKVKVGPIAMTFKGAARFVDRDDEGRTIAMEASGKDIRGAGGVKAKMRMNLVDLGGATQCTVSTDLAVTGKPAQFGRGVMADVSARLVDEFAHRLAEEVERPRDQAVEESRPNEAGAQQKYSASSETDAINLVQSIDAKKMTRAAGAAVVVVAVVWLIFRRMSS